MTVVPALLNTKCVPLLPDMPLPMAVLPPKVRVELVPLTVLLMVVVPLKVNVEPVPLTLPLPGRSEEHTSELQSLMRISYAVFCLKKKNTKTNIFKIQTRQHTANNTQNTHNK